MDITILELSFPDAEFNAPFSNQSAPGKRTKTMDGADENSPPTDPSPLRPIIIGLTILGIALLAKYLRNSTHAPTTD